MSEITEIKTALCNAFCADVQVRDRGGFYTVALPMTARDGDVFTVYVYRARGGWKLSDAATTVMRLSYDNDLGKLFSGPKGKLYETILSEHGISEDDGELYVEVPADKLIQGIFTLSQGMSRVEDIALWTRSRVESTFYSDLREALSSIVPDDDIQENYIPDIDNGQDYQIDYRINTGGWPLFLFGVNGKDKARLTTITLLQLKQAGLEFDSMIVCSDIAELPRADESRLLSAANDVVPSITSIDTMREKIERHRRRAATN